MNYSEDKKTYRRLLGIARKLLLDITEKLIGQFRHLSYRRYPKGAWWTWWALIALIAFISTTASQ